MIIAASADDSSCNGHRGAGYLNAGVSATVLASSRLFTPFNAESTLRKLCFLCFNLIHTLIFFF